MRATGCLAGLLILLWSAAGAQPASPTDRAGALRELDRLAAVPGAEVTRDAAGDVTTVLLRRNGVVIRAGRRGDAVESVGEDGSGHGAVLCIWTIYVDLRAGLDVCFPDAYPALRAELDAAIGRINGFIAANSLPPTTPEAVTAATARRVEAIRAQAAPLGPDHLTTACARSESTPMIISLARLSPADWQRALSDLLAVPRPPVMNPCL